MNKGKDNENLTAGSSAELDGVRRGRQPSGTGDLSGYAGPFCCIAFGRTLSWCVTYSDSAWWERKPVRVQWFTYNADTGCLHTYERPIT
jgi:hypothetical protein